MAHNETVQQRAVMDQAARALRRGYDERAAALLEAELADGHSESDGSEPESSDQEPPPQPGQRCARCGSTRTLELLLPTGRWADAPMEQRLFCDACIEAAETL